MPPTEFRVMPPLRCSERVGNSFESFCGELAAWRRPTSSLLLDQVFCGPHRKQGDEPIAGAQLVRRVRLCLDIELHGLGISATEAHAEALWRLEAAIERLGGLINIHSVTSEIGRFTPPPGPERRKPR